MRYIPEGKMAKLFVFVIVAVLVLQVSPFENIIRKYNFLILFKASFAKPIEANSDNLDSDELIAREAQFEEKLAKTINDQYKAAGDNFENAVNIVSSVFCR